MEGKFTKEFIEQQRMVMEAYEIACLLPAKKLKKLGMFDYKNGQLAATDNYADALVEIERQRCRIAAYQAMNERTVSYLDRLSKYVNDIVIPTIRSIE